MCFYRVHLSVTISYPSTQFNELYGPFVNLGAHLSPKDNSPKKKKDTRSVKGIQNLFFRCHKKLNIIKLFKFF